jgi:hypothetical protein
LQRQKDEYSQITTPAIILLNSGGDDFVAGPVSLVLHCKTAAIPG